MLVRKIPTWKRTRRALTVTALAALFTGGTFLGAGPASAATTLANQCKGAVTGGMGDTVAVPGSAVKEIVRRSAQDQVNFWRLLTVWPDSLANAIANKGNLPVGSIPNAAGGTISGDAIGQVVANALKDEWGLGVLPDTKTKVLNGIRGGVASACGLTTTANNYQAPSSPNSPANGGAPANGNGNAPAQNGGGNPLGSYQPGSTGIAPPRDYGNIPTASPGTPGVLGTAIAPGARYGTLPGSGALPQQPSAGQDPQGQQGPDIRNAGNAEALASQGGASDVQLPMLLAVIVLAGVTAGLVRTWVLRRVS
ncbi:hypothetical protein F9C11_07185 [Amycolatopsis sp. VS8301801F10]|uniref:hypothetical protein n=1 Tax=Amycolatopsis sp. VS8301801F10 TaxID=2652442 RepID=UPI0038FC4AC3